MDLQIFHALVSGRVQGVFFRAATKERAESLNITGWVRNTDDGCVELVACGTQEALTTFKAWLWQGPPSAIVDDVVIDDASVETFTSFDIRY